MPALVAWILEALAVAGRAIVPYAGRAASAIGLTQTYKALVAWFGYNALGEAFAASVQSILIVAGMAAWAVFLGVFWSGVVGFGISDLFSTNPLSGCPAAVMYLVSYAFPLKLAFGIGIAYIQWKFTFVHAAIFMNRIVKTYAGF